MELSVNIFAHVLKYTLVEFYLRGMFLDALFWNVPTELSVNDFVLVLRYTWIEFSHRGFNC